MRKSFHRLKFILILSAVAVCVALTSPSIGSGSEFPEQSRKSILIFYSFESTLPGNSRFLIGFYDALKRSYSGPVDLFQEFTDLGRKDDKDYVSSLRDFYRKKYASKSFDLIVTVNLPALDFILEEGRQVFPGIPLLAAAISEEDLAKRNLIGKVPAVTTFLDSRESIELVLRLQPKCRNLYIITGSSPPEKTLWSFLEDIQKDYKGKLCFIFLSNLSHRELITRVSRLPENSAILFTTLLQDTEGSSFVPRLVCNQLSEAANCPVYGLYEYIGYGIVAGAMGSFHQQGQTAGSLAFRLLFEKDGESQAPIIKVAPLKMVDERQMIRWGIPERNVPEGYEIVNRVPSLWRDYRYHMITAILFFLAQSVLIVSLLIQKRYRKTAEQNLLIAEREAREKAEQLIHADKMISLGVMAAGIAHEIHNPNNFISVNAPLLKKTWEGVVEVLDEAAEGDSELKIGRIPYSRAREQIPDLLNGIIEGSERIRTIVRDMKEFINQTSSGMEEQVDMNSVVRSSLNLLSNKLSKSTHNLHVEYGENVPRLKGNAQHLEQVAVNLILNAAESLPDSEKAITVKTTFDGDRHLICLTVTDEGRGINSETLGKIFDPFFTTKRETGGTGLGLAISLSIVKAHGGQILISSGEREGTTTVVELPAAGGNNSR
jgi:signal transduction histidine kinase